MSDDLHPRSPGLYLHQFAEAYEAHQSAGATYQTANRIPPKDEAPATTEQRKAILTIAARLLVKRRDELLDDFCVAWLRYRELPIPKYEQPKGPSDVGGGSTSPPQDGVQTPLRGASGNATPDNRSNQASTGESLP